MIASFSIMIPKNWNYYSLAFLYYRLFIHHPEVMQVYVAIMIYSFYLAVYVNNSRIKMYNLY